MLDRAGSVLVLIDVQERLFQTMPDPSSLVKRCGLLLESAALLHVPVMATEQIPAKLGDTVSPLREAMGSAPVFSKSSFSILGAPGMADALQTTGCRQVVLCGIEAHVCVLQSALQLQDNGYAVFLVTDAVMSRRESDSATALKRMIQAGIQPVTAEMVVFEWLRNADDPAFRAVHAKIKHG